MKGNAADAAFGRTMVEFVRVQRAFSDTPDPNTGLVPNRDDARALFAFQCRDFVSAIDELPADEQPVGWNINLPDVIA